MPQHYYLLGTLVLRISPSCIHFLSSDVIQGELRARTRIVLRGACLSTIERNNLFHCNHCCEVFWRLRILSLFVFVLDVSLVTRVLLWSLYRSRLIRICVDRFTNCITFWSSFSTWMSCIKFNCQSLKWARFGTVVAFENIRLSSLFAAGVVVDGDVSPAAKSEEKRMFSQVRTVTDLHQSSCFGLR